MVIEDVRLWRAAGIQSIASIDMNIIDERLDPATKIGILTVHQSTKDITWHN